MSNQATTTADSVGDTRLRQEANREFRKRMAIKLLAVSVVVLAFAFIRGIEARKRAYDEAHNRPIVIVTDQFWTDCGGEPLVASPAPIPAPPPLPVHAKCGDARLIAASLIRTPLARELNRPQDKKSLDELSAVIEKLKYQDFQSESDILQRFDAEILTTADYFKRGISTTVESERKSMLNKQAELKQDEPLVKEKLRAIHKKLKDVPEFEAWLIKETEPSPDAALPTDETVVKWRLRPDSTDLARGQGPRVVNGRTQSTAFTAAELLSWYRKIRTDPDDTKLKVFNTNIRAVDDDAQKKISLIYQKLKPELPGLVSNALFPQPKEDGLLARLNPTGMYDEKSGSHVVYQTLWMTCAMTLVFGVLFGVFLILRLIPGVADGMEILRTHAGDLFAHAGMAVPQAGKSLLVGAAALGVGAVVTVGGTAAVSQLHVVETESIRGADGRTGERGKTGDTGKAGDPGKTGERGPAGNGNEPLTGPFTVELQGPIALSSPITVEGPKTVTLNADSLQALQGYITQLSHPALSTEITSQMTEVANSIAKKTVTDQISALNIKSLDDRLLKLEGQQQLESRVIDLEKKVNSWPTTLGDQLTGSLKPLKDEVTAARTAIEGLNMQPGSGPQGLFPRLKGAFKGDRYLMTYQSLTSIGLLIRTSASQKCTANVASSPPCCSSASLIATCPDQLIFSSLASMIGGPPLDEKAFWAKLKKIWQPQWDAETEKAAKEKRKTTSLNIDDWKVIILRQARMAY